MMWPATARTTTRQKVLDVLSITDYDRFTAAFPRAAQIALDVVAGRARHAAVLQRRCFCLLHSNDLDIRFEPVGAMPVR